MWTYTCPFSLIFLVLRSELPPIKPLYFLQYEYLSTLKPKSLIGFLSIPVHLHSTDNIILTGCYAGPHRCTQSVWQGTPPEARHAIDLSLGQALQYLYNLLSSKDDVILSTVLEADFTESLMRNYVTERNWTSIHGYLR